MRVETYEPWYSANFLRSMKVSLKKISFHPIEGMVIDLLETGNRDHQFRICFRELPIATRITNESQRLISLRGVPEGLPHFINVVHNSRFISWLNSESLGIYNDDPWIHVSVIADDEWIDVITTDMPQVIAIGRTSKRAIRKLDGE